MVEKHTSHKLEHAHAQREETRFRVAARRNKLLGLWAAQLLGKSVDATEAYAKEVIASDLEEAGDEDVVRKLRTDFAAGGVTVGDDAIRAKIQEMEAEARRQLAG
jgi:hypothetical protein